MEQQHSSTSTHPESAPGHDAVHPPLPAGPAPHASSPEDERALRHARAIVGELFGPVAMRPMHVRYWDGSVERGRTDSTFSLLINRRGALRRMLLPPSELAIVESYLSGDVDVEGDLESATELGDAIAARLRSARALGSILRHLVALPTGEPALPVTAARHPGALGVDPKDVVQSIWLIGVLWPRALCGRRQL